jgi:hypothetical protein
MGALPPAKVTIAEGERVVKAASIDLGGPVVAVEVRRDAMTFAYTVDIHGRGKRHTMTIDEWERLKCAPEVSSPSSPPTPTTRRRSS